MTSRLWVVYALVATSILTYIAAWAAGWLTAGDLAIRLFYASFALAVAGLAFAVALRVGIIKVVR